MIDRWIGGELHRVHLDEARPAERRGAKPEDTDGVPQRRGLSKDRQRYAGRLPTLLTRHTPAAPDTTSWQPVGPLPDVAGAVTGERRRGANGRSARHETPRAGSGTTDANAAQSDGVTMEPLADMPKFAAKMLKSFRLTTPSSLKSPVVHARPVPPKLAAKTLKSLRFTTSSRFASPPIATRAVSNRVNGSRVAAPG